MAKKKTPGGTAGKGGVNPAPTRDDQTVRIAAEQLTMVPIDDLIPYANNAKKHGVKQINQLRASLREFPAQGPGHKPENKKGKGRRALVSGAC